LKIKAIWEESFQLSPAITCLNGKIVKTLNVSRKDNIKKTPTLQLGYKRSYVQTLNTSSNSDLLENVENDSKTAKERRMKFYSLLVEYATKEHNVNII
jgi:hypothetical protein